MCSSEGGPALGLGGESDAIDLVSEDDPMQALPGGTQICGKRQLAAVTLVLASLAPRPGTGTIVCTAALGMIGRSRVGAYFYPSEKLYLLRY